MSALLGLLPAPGHPPDADRWARAESCLRSRCAGPITRLQEEGLLLSVRAVEPEALAQSPRFVAVLDGYLESPSPGTPPWTSSAQVALTMLSGDDTETVQLGGSFSLARFDRDTRELVLQRDLLGTRPLYYAVVQEGFAFASEMKALVALRGHLTVEPSSLQDIFALRHSPAATTLYAGVWQVPPGTRVRISPEGTIRSSVHRRFGFADSPAGNGITGVSQAADRLEAALRTCLRRAAGASGSTTVLLSGGIDSSLLAAMARECFPRVTCITAVLEGRENPELDRAKAVAQALDLPHQLVTVSDEDVAATFSDIMYRMEEPPRHFNNVVVARLLGEARAHAPGVLVGDYADILFGGSSVSAVRRFEHRTRVVSRVPRWVRRGGAAVLARLPWARGKRLAELLVGSAVEYALAMDSHRPSPRERRALGGTVSAFSPSAETRRMYADPTAALENLYAVFNMYTDGAAHLTRYDRLAEPLGLRIHYPFLSPEVLGVAASLPVPLRIPNPHTKPVLREVARRHLPPDVLAWPKLGFPTPRYEWMANPLREYLQKVYQPSRWLDPVVPLERRRTLHPADDYQVVWTLMCLQEVLDRLSVPCAGAPPPDLQATP